MSIQVTPIPRLTVLTVPAFTLGTANAAGSAVTAIASDSTILTYDTTLPANLGTSAVGTATTAPRRDHVHGGSPALGTLAKCWVNWEMTGAHGILASFNYTSVTDDGVGKTDHVIDTPFSSANYVLAGCGVDVPCIYLAGAGHDANSWKTVISNQAGTLIDSTDAQLAGFGDQ